MHCCIVTFWFSPFPLSAALEEHLRAAGMQPHLESPDLLSADSLILYPQPHALVGMDGASDDPQVWFTGYTELLQYSSQHRAVAVWRLQTMPPEAIASWLSDGLVSSPLDLPAMEPLQALITRELLQAYPQLLEAYLDLELQAELLGCVPDSNYLERLRAACTAEALISEQKAEGSKRKKLAAQVQDAQEEANLNLLHLQQVQQDLEQMLITSQEQEKALAATREELSKANQDREELRAELKVSVSEREKLAGQMKEAQEKAKLTLQDLQNELDQVRSNSQEQEKELAVNRDELSKANKNCKELRVELKVAGSEREKLADQVRDAQHEAELTLLNLHQVQEELELIFLTSQEQEKELAANRDELSKAHKNCEDLRAELKVAGSEREKLAGQMKEAQEKAKRTLQQVQNELEKLCQTSQEKEKELAATREELEHYILLSADQQAMIERQNKLSTKALALAAAAC